MSRRKWQEFLKRSETLQDHPFLKCPHSPSSPQNPTPSRDGFLDYPAFLSVLESLAAQYRPITKFACLTGWRQGECIKLTFDRVNLGQGTIRLSPSQTKGKASRNRVMRTTVREIIEERFLPLGVQCLIWPHLPTGAPYVFQRDGKKISRWTLTDNFKAACAEAGVGDGMIFHDLRRSFARNARNAGSSESEIMAQAGWKTRSVFDRYNIIDENDMRRAAEKQEAFLEAELNRDSIVTAVDFDRRKRENVQKVHAANSSE